MSVNFIGVATDSISLSCAAALSHNRSTEKSAPTLINFFASRVLSDKARAAEHAPQVNDMLLSTKKCLIRLSDIPGNRRESRDGLRWPMSRQLHKSKSQSACMARIS